MGKVRKIEIARTGAGENDGEKVQEFMQFIARKIAAFTDKNHILFQQVTVAPIDQGGKIAYQVNSQWGRAQEAER